MDNQWNLLRRAWLAGIIVTLAAHPAMAQSATGAVQGVVVDQSGGVVPGVSVVVTSTSTAAARSMVTDHLGGFTAELLPVGRYEVSTSLSGFTTTKTSATVTVGATITLRIEMRVAASAATVNVSGIAAVESTRSQVSSTIDGRAVSNLPTNGRNFISFALLTPGVTTDVRTGDISFAGQRGTLNSLIVDGADNNNTFFGQSVGRTGSGRAPYQFSAASVQEFQVNSNAYSAEYGRAGGAVINVVTKSGSNTVQGEMFEYYRDESLNAINLINKQQGRAKSIYHFNQFGGVFGGPIRKNRDFVFANYDGQRNTLPNLVFLNVPSTAPSDANTAAAIATLTPLANSWNQAQNQNTFFIKTDHELNSSNRLSLRYNHQNFNGKNFENSGAQNAEQHTGDSNVRTRTLNATFTSVFSNTTFNEVKVQWARDQEPGQSNTSDPEAVIQQSGVTVLTIGRNSFSPRETTIKRWQFADTITWVTGRHTIRGGADFQFDNILNYFPGNFFGAYTFSSLAGFTTKTPTRFVQAFADPGTTGPTTHPDIKEYSVFVQDAWRPTPELTVNLGARYDLQQFAKPSVKNPDAQLAVAGIDTSYLPTDKNNFAPRLGLAWAPKSRPLVVRAGYGVFYGRTPSIMVGTAHSNNGVNVQTITFTGASMPVYPAIFAAPPTGAALPKPTIFTFSRDYENAKVQQASVGAQYEVMPGTTVTVTYLYVHGSSLPRSTDLNIGASSATTYTTTSGQALTYYRFAAGPFTNFARVISFQSTAQSTYRGVTIDLSRRLMNHVSFSAAYTLGKVEDTVPDATAVVPGSSSDDSKYASNPSNFEADRAPGSNDQRHRFVFSGIFDTNGISGTGILPMLVRDWTISTILTLSSGQPYSARVGAVDLNGDGNTRNDLAPGTTRNQYRLPNYYAMDLRVSRTINLHGRFSVQPIVEAFNLFNADNVNNINATLYGVNTTTNVLTPNTSFGAALGTAGQRIVQLGVRLLF